MELRLFWKLLSGDHIPSGGLQDRHIRCGAGDALAGRSFRQRHLIHLRNTRVSQMIHRSRPAGREISVTGV